jgi:hypothetical protein
MTLRGVAGSRLTGVQNLMTFVKPFREFNACDLDSRSAAEQINSKGYLLIRGLLPLEELKKVLTEIVGIVYRAGWLRRGCDPIERIVDEAAACGESDPSFKRVYQEVFSLESFHALTHNPALRRIMTLLAGERLLIHPKPIGRLIFPRCERFVVRAHQDHRAIGGDPESFTAWIALHDCALESGSLQILESSHHFGLQDCDPVTGLIPEESVQGGEWVGGNINAGDVLIFHSLTVHAASRNTTEKLRISLDCRFQSVDRPVDPATLVFVGSRSWENTYASWRCNDLKYFWRNMPLQLRPSKAELAQLAITADAPEMRNRYATILRQITAEMLD